MHLHLCVCLSARWENAGSQGAEAFDVIFISVSPAPTTARVVGAQRVLVDD